MGTVPFSITFAVVLLLCVNAMAADPADGRGRDWQSWSPRPEIAPTFARQSDVLEIRATGNPAIYGGWRKRIDGVKPGSMYRFAAFYRGEKLENAAFHTAARIAWLDADGNRINPMDYAMETQLPQSQAAGEWTPVELRSPSPDKAVAALLELDLRWATGGAVAWKDVSLKEDVAQAKRLVRVATVGYRPSATGSAEASIGKFCDLVRAMEGEVDLICLPEGASVIGTDKTYAEVAQEIPGPLSQRLSEVAKAKRSYLVAGLYEKEGKEGGCIYNTAILLDREGKVVGKYRKTHLPSSEAEGGLTPGREYPVFDTDFGRLGILICWDLQFPEPWRAMALKRAEIMALPIWGGNEVLARARAIENHVYLVSASYDMKTMVIDPTGEIMTEAKPDQPIARTTIDLNRVILQLPWLGNMGTMTWKERRGDLGGVEAR